jgi:hypothetical protein
VAAEAADGSHGRRDEGVSDTVEAEEVGEEMSGTDIEVEV